MPRDCRTSRPPRSQLQSATRASGPRGRLCSRSRKRRCRSEAAAWRPTFPAPFLRHSIKKDQGGYKERPTPGPDRAGDDADDQPQNEPTGICHGTHAVAFSGAFQWHAAENGCHHAVVADPCIDEPRTTKALSNEELLGSKRQVMSDKMLDLVARRFRTLGEPYYAQNASGTSAAMGRTCRRIPC